MKYKYKTGTPKLGVKHKAKNFVEPEIPSDISHLLFDPKEVKLKFFQIFKV